MKHAAMQLVQQRTFASVQGGRRPCSLRQPLAAQAAPHAVSGGATSSACSCSSPSVPAIDGVSSRRGMLLGVGTLLAAAGTVLQRPAAALAATTSASDAGNKALLDYMDLESKGKLKDKKGLDDFR